MLDFILSEVKRVLRKGGCIFVVDFKPDESDGLYPICGGMYRARSPKWSDEVFPLFTPDIIETVFGFELLESKDLTLTSYHGNKYPGIAALLRDKS